MVRHSFLIACVVMCAAGLASAQRAGSSEPGQAESQDRTRAVKLPSTWSSPAKEARAIWIASHEMLLPREKIAAKLDAIRDAGFNTVMVDSWFRGYAGFDGSSVAPRYPQLDGDVFGFILEQSRARGLSVHSWPEYGFYAYHTKDPVADRSKGPILDRHPDLVAVNARGEQYLSNPQFGSFYSMCPSNPRSHRLLGQVIVDSITRYDVDGVNLDRIRYPESDYCFCNHCREHFQKDTGLALENFPAGSENARRLLDWRREQTATAVATIREMIHAARPGMPITAYVVGPFEMDSKAQGWDLWARRGLVDAVAVSMYGADIEPAAKRAIELLGPAKDKLVCAVNAALDTEIYASNLEIARKYSSLGQFTWWAGAIEPHVELLRKGPYARPAETTIQPTK